MAQELRDENHVILTSWYSLYGQPAERTDQDEEYTAADQVEDQVGIGDLQARIPIQGHNKGGERPEEGKKEEDPQKVEEKMGYRRSFCRGVHAKGNQQSSCRRSQVCTHQDRDCDRGADQPVLGEDDDKPGGDRTGLEDVGDDKPECYLEEDRIHHANELESAADQSGRVP